MKKIILFLFIISFSFSFVSCRSSSGWSCKKRYVKTELPTQKAKAIFYRQC